MKQNAELTALSHQLGELIHNWGFKRIHGRIWTRLFLSTRPLDAADLIQQLDISKALVSISLRELVELKAIQEVGRSARGTNLYRANGDLKEIYLELLRRREREMLEQTAAALSLLSNLDAVTLSESDISPQQMNVLAQHLTQAMTSVNDTLKNAESSPDSVVMFKSPRKTEMKAEAMTSDGASF
jgi:DNA-binding transcriptional regulator GbsR (MarR family)